MYFRSAVRGRMEVPVRGTFIHFDIPQTLTSALQRSSTCPGLLHPGLIADSAAGELCHAMAPLCLHTGGSPLSRSCTQSDNDMSPMTPQPASIFSTKSVGESSDSRQGGAKSRSQASVFDAQGSMKSRTQPDSEARDVSPDGISEASTKESAGPIESPSSKDEALQTWTSIPSRKKKGLARPEQSDIRERDTREQRVPTPVAAQRLQTPTKDAGSERITRSENVGKGGNDMVYAPQREKPGGKGKGLSHFERIDVGVEDDNDFRVVQRLIGPRGKHMQEITMQCKGAKVWIIGRGSRSWEDSLGPLMICVGATTKSIFESAVALIQELLGRIKDDHKAFLRGAT